ncbi:MAG: anaphase-promoting complex subunit cdc27 [Chaenotheca gracillima]|nr:MAG: anaphase-promoting complex subunit cdc27 [Chaenotheca gracillima]
MAQKAAKSLAKRNTQILSRTHLISLALHTFHILAHIFLASFFGRRRSWTLYILLSAPGLIIEFWFERIGRPKYHAGTAAGAGAGAGELRRSGEDLEAKGLTEWMWDVLYWTWGCVGVVAVLGDWGWWLWAAIPLYSAYLAYTTFGSVRQGMAGMGGGGAVGPGEAGSEGQPQSARQKKMEKRGGQQGQRVAYR